MKLNIEAREFIRDFVYSMRDAGHEFPESKRVELTHGIEKICESLLLEAEQKVKPEITRDETGNSNAVQQTLIMQGYKMAVSDCKQVLREMRGV